jgi:hypothetical protein
LSKENPTFVEKIALLFIDLIDRTFFNSFYSEKYFMLSTNFVVFIWQHWRRLNSNEQRRLLPSLSPFLSLSLVRGFLTDELRP